MRAHTMILLTTFTMTACKKGAKDIKALCEDNFSKGAFDNGKWTPGTGDKAAFMEFCTKQSADVVRCSSMEIEMGDKSCEEHTGVKSPAGFKAKMQIMALRNGTASTPPGPKAEATPPPPDSTALTLIMEKGAPSTFKPQQGIASTGSSPKGLSVYLIGDCPALPANACEWLPKGWVNTDFDKLSAQCPDFREVVIRLSYDDQMKEMPATDLKPGTYGRTSDPIRASLVQVNHKDGAKNFQVSSEKLLDITKADATRIEGTLTAKDEFGNQVTGPFSASVCQY